MFDWNGFFRWVAQPPTSWLWCFCWISRSSITPELGQGYIMYMDVSKNRGTPNGWFIKWKTLLKWMIRGYHYSRKHSYTHQLFFKDWHWASIIGFFPFYHHPCCILLLSKATTPQLGFLELVIFTMTSPVVVGFFGKQEEWSVISSFGGLCLRAVFKKKCSANIPAVSSEESNCFFEFLFCGGMVNMFVHFCVYMFFHIYLYILYLYIFNICTYFPPCYMYMYIFICLCTYIEIYPTFAWLSAASFHSSPVKLAKASGESRYQFRGCRR